jgi:CDGSH-type Zn-finger protein
MSDESNKPRIRITMDGPIIVEGSLPLAEETMVLGPDGEPKSWVRGADIETTKAYALCRCGKTARRPFCDGSHTREGFQGTETALRELPPKAAELTEGPEMSLADIPCLCAIARFCHSRGDAWTQTEQSDDPIKKQAAMESAANCPSGRLTAIDKPSGLALEPTLEPSIGLIRDTYHSGLGPIWVKGGVEIESAKGHAYAARNRVTLCRCGNSNNKPLCDGSHLKCRFGKNEETP